MTSVIKLVMSADEAARAVNALSNGEMFPSLADITRIHLRFSPAGRWLCKVAILNICNEGSN